MRRALFGILHATHLKRKLRFEFGVKTPKDLFTKSRTWHC